MTKLHNAIIIKMIRNIIRAELRALLPVVLVDDHLPSHKRRPRPSVAPHVRLWQLIAESKAVFPEKSRKQNSPDEWCGTATQLHDLLLSERSKLSPYNKKAIPAPSWIGQRLESCRDQFGPDVCDQRRNGKARVWMLRPKKGLVDA